MTDVPIERGSEQWLLRDALMMQEIASRVEENGFVLVPVFPVDDAPGSVPFVYTIGMTHRGLPELLIAGLPPDMAHDLLVWSVARHRERALRPGDRPLLDEADPPLPLRVVAMPSETPVLGTAYRFYGHLGVRGLQLLYPDDHELFPTQPGYRGPSQSLR